MKWYIFLEIVLVRFIIVYNLVFCKIKNLKLLEILIILVMFIFLIGGRDLLSVNLGKRGFFCINILFILFK